MSHIDNIDSLSVSPSPLQSLKTVCWGGPNIVPRPEWIKTGAIFHDPEQTNAYGLKAVKGATKSFQLILGTDNKFAQ